MKCFRLPTLRSETPGFKELRRHVIVGAPAAIATCLTSPNHLMAAVGKPEPRDQLERFIESSAERALQLKADVSMSGQDNYVDYLANAVTSVEDLPKDGLSRKSWKNLEPGVFLGTSGRNRAFFVVHWQLEPYAVLPPHCHPMTSVCTLGLEGAATLRHFEAEPSAPSYRDDRDSEFLITETRRIELLAGSVSTLTQSRDNIHLFVAGNQGARGIDVTTDYGGDGSFSFLEFDHERPMKQGANIYSARWIGTSLS